MGEAAAILPPLCSGKETVMQLVTKSRINGTFTGWKGGNVYTLVNGQKWMQITYKYRYKYKYRPQATVWRNGSQYYLEVEGMGEMLRVRRI